jgi:hypothetical protein
VSDQKQSWLIWQKQSIKGNFKEENKEMNSAQITVLNFRCEKPEFGATLPILDIWWVPV